MRAAVAAAGFLFVALAFSALWGWLSGLCHCGL